MRMKGKGNSTNLFWYHWKHWDFLLGKSIYEWWPRKQERGSSQCAKVKEKGKLPIDGCGDNDRSSSSSFLEITWEPGKLLFRFRFSGWLHLAAPAAGLSFSAGSLQSSCPGFAVVEFCYSALSRPDQAICYSLLTGRSSRDENRMKGTFFESSTSARRSMLMVSGITLLFLPVCSRKRVSISIGVPVRQHPPARLTQGFAGLQKALKSYRRV